LTPGINYVCNLLEKGSGIYQYSLLSIINQWVDFTAFLQKIVELSIQLQISGDYYHHWDFKRWNEVWKLHFIFYDPKVYNREFKRGENAPEGRSW